jgi:hypothetical protein
MQTTSEPDGRKAGATWVAATGAFLLLAAAAVFIAVRWDQLPEAAKLALVGAMTGGFLVGGRALRRSLPATGDVLFHLGAFLLPVDVAGLNLRVGAGWRALLLTEGIVGVGALGALAAGSGSVVLLSSAAISVAVLAAGIAALTPVPAGLALAVAALAAHFTKRSRPAIAWAALAGLAPIVGVAVRAGLHLIGSAPGDGVLRELGLIGTQAGLLAILSSGIAAFVLGREAARRHDLALVALAGTVLATGAATTWVAADPTREANTLGAPALFVAIQLVVMLCTRDAFWRKPANAVGIGSEVLAALAFPVAALYILAAPFIDLFDDSVRSQFEPSVGMAWALLAVGWLLAAWRRRPPTTSVLSALRDSVSDTRTVLFFASAAGAAAVAGTSSTRVAAIAFLLLAAALVASRGVFATVIAAGLAAWTPVTLMGTVPMGVAASGLLAAGVVVAAAILWRDTADGVPSAALAGWGAAISLGACIGPATRDALSPTAALLLAVGAAWALAVVADRATTVSGHLVRGSALLVVAVSFTVRPAEALPAVLVAIALFAVDAIRLDDPLVGCGAALSVPVALALGAAVAGIDAPTTGVVLCGSATVAGGLASLVSQRWRLPFFVAVGAGVVSGLPLAALDQARGAEALLLVGGLVVGAGLLTRRGPIAHLGGGLMIVAIIERLTVAGVGATEPFVAPVALQLAIAGWQLRRRADPPSSWVAFGPAVALLGGAALAERLSGGPAWHALVAGFVGVLAVAAGGWHRLAGPLFLGTGLLVAVTIIESFSTLAGVPTWAWLATGGALLLGIGIALERAASSPVEAGRRLVDIVGDRFE